MKQAKGRGCESFHKKESGERDTREILKCLRILYHVNAPGPVAGTTELCHRLLR